MNYLHFYFPEGGSIKLDKYGSPDSINMTYSFDGTTWNTYNISDNITVSSNGYIYFKGNNPDGLLDSAANYYYFILTTNNDSKCYVGGNIMSLLSETESTTIPNRRCFYKLFYNCDKLDINPNDMLILPATTLTDECYEKMFESCTLLTQAPSLPATTLASYCYYEMFEYCTSLTTAPELPATTLAENCYRGMFMNCTSLTTAPELLATELAIGCYARMFYGCTSLTTAPELPATTLAYYCYQFMFSDCTSLNYVKANFLKWTNATMGWLYKVSSNGTFECLDIDLATQSGRGSETIPIGWTVTDQPQHTAKPNKVIYGNTTKLDISQDDVNENKLLQGTIAHHKSGNQITGTLKTQKPTKVLLNSLLENQRIVDLWDTNTMIAHLEEGDYYRVPLGAVSAAKKIENYIRFEVSSAGAFQVVNAVTTTPIVLESAVAAYADYGVDILFLKRIDDISLLVIWNGKTSDYTAGKVYGIMLSLKSDGSIYKQPSAYTLVNANQRKPVSPNAAAGSYYSGFNLFPARDTNTETPGFGITYYRYVISKANVVTHKYAYMQTLQVYHGVAASRMLIGGSFSTAPASYTNSAGIDSVTYPKFEWSDSLQGGATIVRQNSASQVLTSHYLLKEATGATGATAAMTIIGGTYANSDFPTLSILGRLETGEIVMCHGSEYTQGSAYNYKQLGIGKLHLSTTNNNAETSIETLQIINMSNSLLDVTCENYIILKGNVLYCKTTGQAWQIMHNYSTGSYSLYDIGTFVNVALDNRGQSTANVALPQGTFSSKYYEIGETFI